ncbi:MAG TPA: cytochrome d ubiquinol oxidase subunit II [Steroidobacteraceae bacterium]|jgi:cytochrome d ubiquinol oxidase subunit II|nr:cytochrome d ubiquinol oxidase subunit II [Steroidobacteraceae bacterium]
MPNYETLRVIWWLILGVLLMGFAVTDGFDMGVCAIFRFAGRTDDERRALLESVEPVWEGNQVWFILGGGAVFAAWPLLYAAAFSSLYLAMFLVLAGLIVRPVGFAFRGKLALPAWRNTCDWALLTSGVVPALLFGVAFGNLFIGVPFHFDSMMRPVYTGGFFNLLHPFALLSGLVSLSMLVMHGATYASLKVEGELGERAAAIAKVAAAAFAIAFIAAGIWVFAGLNGWRITSMANEAGPSNPLFKTVVYGRGAWLENYRVHGLLWLAPLAGLGSALLTYLLLRVGRSGAALIASGVTQAATILTAGIALYPFLMPSSTHPNDSLTIWDASGSAESLFIMLIAVIIFLPIVLAYTAWVYRKLRGQISLDTIRRHVGPY